MHGGARSALIVERNGFMSVALSVVFTGLCALVGDGDGKPGEILLIDPRAVGEVQGIAVPEHAPTLALSMSGLANPDSSRPNRVVAGTPDRTGRVAQLGLWYLSGSEVRIRAQGGDASSLRFYRPAPGETSWPEPPRNAQDPSSWRDLRYVANLAGLVGDGRIDPALTGDGTAHTTLPPSV